MTRQTRIWNPIVLVSVARIRRAHTREMISSRYLSDVGVGDSLTWEALELGDPERFANSLRNDLERAAEDLASEIVTGLWSQPRSP